MARTTEEIRREWDRSYIYTVIVDDCSLHQKPNLFLRQFKWEWPKRDISDDYYDDTVTYKKKGGLHFKGEEKPLPKDSLVILNEFVFRIRTGYEYWGNDYVAYLVSVLPPNKDIKEQKNWEYGLLYAEYKGKKQLERTNRRVFVGLNKGEKYGADWDREKIYVINNTATVLRDHNEYSKYFKGQWPERNISLEYDKVPHLKAVEKLPNGSKFPDGGKLPNGALVNLDKFIFSMEMKDSSNSHSSKNKCYVAYLASVLLPNQKRNETWPYGVLFVEYANKKQIERMEKTASKTNTETGYRTVNEKHKSDGKIPHKPVNMSRNSDANVSAGYYYAGEGTFHGAIDIGTGDKDDAEALAMFNVTLVSSGTSPRGGWDLKMKIEDDYIFEYKGKKENFKGKYLFYCHLRDNPLEYLLKERKIKSIERKDYVGIKISAGEAVGIVGGTGHRTKKWERGDPPGYRIHLHLRIQRKKEYKRTEAELININQIFRDREKDWYRIPYKLLDTPPKK